MEGEIQEVKKKRAPMRQHRGCIYRPTYKDRKTGERRESRTYWIKFHHKGRAFYENTHTKIKEQAKDLLIKRLEEVQTDRFIGLRPGELTVRDMVKDVVADYELLGNRSTTRLGQGISYLLKFFGDTKASEVGSFLINRYREFRQRPPNEADHVKGLSTGASIATVNRELAALRRAFYIAFEHEPPKVARVPKIELLPEENVREGFFTTIQFRQLLAELPWYLKPVVVTLFYTGMRIGEVLSLRWEQVDLESRMIRLPRWRTKARRPRNAPMGSELFRAIENQRKLRDEKFPNCEWVFFGETGKRIKNPYGAWGSAWKRAGVWFIDAAGNKVAPIFHDFRRTAARNMRRGGTAETVIMDIAGWKTQSVFKRYAIGDEVDAQDAAKRYDALVERETGESLVKDSREIADKPLIIQ